MIAQSLRSTLRDEEGASLVEFALIAPTLLVLLLGAFDLCYNVYGNTMLQGAIQEAARDSSLQDPNEATIDAAVTDAVQDIVPNALLTFSRKSYGKAYEVGQAEDFTDLNGDNQCNDGEPFVDANNNGYWDSDKGDTSKAGARDTVLYEVTVSYPRAFPVAPLIGMSPRYETKISTLLRVQPFGLQDERAKVNNCV